MVSADTKLFLEYVYSRSYVSFRCEKHAYLHSDLDRFPCENKREDSNARDYEEAKLWIDLTLGRPRFISDSAYFIIFLRTIVTEADICFAGFRASGSRACSAQFPRRNQNCVQAFRVQKHMSIYSWIIYIALCFLLCFGEANDGIYIRQHVTYVIQRHAVLWFVLNEFLKPRVNWKKTSNAIDLRDLAKRVVKLKIICREKRGNPLSKKNWSRILNF